MGDSEQAQSGKKSAALLNMTAASKAADGIALEAADLQPGLEEDDWDLDPEGSPADFETAFDIPMEQLSEKEQKQRA